jgi:hypothetical protein
MASKNQTFIAYEGPSLIDGNPIVVLVQTGSSNRKTGDMVQTYILRSDIDPITASRTGQDVSICGDCIHRGKANDNDSGQATDRTCYVTLAHGPLGKFKAYVRGAYEYATGHDKIRALGLGRIVRLGTYGDPCAVPQYIWDSLLSASAGHTGYTHGAINPAPHMLMTSADSITQAESAWARGERTFRVISSLDRLVRKSETLCPASDEYAETFNKPKRTCETCGLCTGTMSKGKSVAIVAHGTAKRKAKALVS